jgi:Flp pilus assembly protein TadD
MDSQIDAVASDEAAPAAASSSIVDWVKPVIPVLLAILTVLAFLPSLQNGFVNWDDQPNLLENPNYRGLGWTNLYWMFTTFHHSLYRPLTWVSLGLDYIFWGMNPLGYHLTSLLFHAANAVLVFYLTQQLLTLRYTTGVAPTDLSVRMPAAFAALAFAVHPLRVESVAWVSARNDVLSAFFLLLTVIFYLQYAKREASDQNSRRWFAAALGAYACSLLSKASGVTLPLVLLVLDVYPLGRLGNQGWFNPFVRKVWWEKLPFFFLALIAGVAAFAAKYEYGSMAAVEAYGFSARAAQSLYGLSFYLWKTLVPLDLSPLYERPADLSILDFVSLRSGIIFSAVTAGFIVARRRWPAGLAAWICYVLFLVPTLGIAQSGPQIAADRYSYLACVGFAVLAGGALVEAWQLWRSGRAGAMNFVLVNSFAAFIVLGLGYLTWRQTEIWHDSERFWNHALAVMPSGLPHYYLGTVLADRGRTDEAIDHFRHTLEINDSYADAHYNLGKLLARRGDFNEAGQHFRSAVKLNPNDAGAHSGLGLILAREGNLAEAARYFRRALEINPADPAALNNMGITLAREGDLDGAIRYFKRAVETNPSDAGGYGNLANALLQRGEIGEAVKYLRRALELNPRDAENHANLGMILAGQGDLKAAITHFQRALEINPNDPGTHNNLGITLVRQGNVNEAINHFQEALRINPEFAEAHAALARALTMQGKRSEAIDHYEEALRLLRSKKKIASQR